MIVINNTLRFGMHIEYSCTKVSFLLSLPFLGLCQIPKTSLFILEWMNRICKRMASIPLDPNYRQRIKKEKPTINILVSATILAGSLWLPQISTSFWNKDSPFCPDGTGQEEDVEHAAFYYGRFVKLRSNLPVPQYLLREMVNSDKRWSYKNYSRGV